MAKLLYISFLLLVLSSKLLCRDYVSTALSVSNPMDKYKDDEVFGAKNGYQITILDYSHINTKNFGISLSFTQGSNESKVFPDSYYKNMGVLIGPSFSFMIAENIETDIKAKIGYAYYKREIEHSPSNKSIFRAENTLYNIQMNCRLPLYDNFGISALLEYYTGKFQFQDNNFKQEIEYFTYGLGIYYKL